MNSIAIFFCLHFICFTEAYKILVYYPLPVRSVNILGRAAVRHLLEAGHEVTFVTAFPMKLSHKNLRQIDTGLNADNFLNEGHYSVGYILENKIVSNDVSGCQHLAKQNAKDSLENENVTRFLGDPNEKFYGVIVDFFESEVYAGLSALYDCPMIWLYSMGAHWQMLRFISEASNPAYDTDHLSTTILPHNFMRRIEELFRRFHWAFVKTLVTKPFEKELYETTFGPLLAKRGRPLPAYEDVLFNVSFIFGNEHNAITMRPSTPQNFKYIGGFHVEDPVVPLPQDLQELMDKSSNGVIYFSLGSFFKSKELPNTLIREILDVFEELKQTVIWKFEADLNDVPKNVRVVKWAPQQSILAHKNTKLFISHGGLLSSIETIHFGVPVIGIPVLFDQFTNVIKAVKHGYALHVNLDYDMAKNLKKNINIMLSDNRYKHKVQELSQIYHDTPVKPGAELVHWVNHVIKTRGAPHLRSPDLRVPLYQKLYLDLFALIIAVLIFLIASLNIILSFFFPKREYQKVKEN